MVPDLTSLFENPARVEDLAPETIPPLLAALAALQGALAARLLKEPIRGEASAQAQEVETRLLTIREVAGLIGVPNGYVYELARRGEIPAVRFGKYVRVSASALREWLGRRQENRRDTPTSSTYSRRRTRRNDAPTASVSGGSPRIPR